MVVALCVVVVGVVSQCNLLHHDLPSIPTLREWHEHPAVGISTYRQWILEQRVNNCRSCCSCCVDCCDLTRGRKFVVNRYVKVRGNNGSMCCVIETNLPLRFVLRHPKRADAMSYFDGHGGD